MGYPASAKGPLAAVVLGGMAAGLIDLSYAILASAAKGVSVTRVLQSVAGGLLGSQAYRGDLATAALGVALHFCMTIAMAALFIALARRSQRLRRHLLLSGLAYGALIYFTMRWLVVPLSRFPGDLRSFNPGEFAVHMFGVGLVIALSARWLGAVPAEPGLRRR